MLPLPYIAVLEVMYMSVFLLTQALFEFIVWEPYWA